jgi:hypothetical protein
MDGQAVGTGTYDGDVLAGNHVFRVTAPGYEPAEQTLSVVSQATQSANVALKRAVSAEELARQKEESEAEAFRGGYGQFTVFGAFAASSSHLSCDDLAGSLTVTCGTGVPYGGGLSLRGGYAFGLVGIEGVLVLMGNAWQDTASYAASSAPNPSPQSASDVAHDETYSFVRAGGLIGAGPRLTTSGRTLRFTVGAAGGLAVTALFVSRTVANGLSEAPPYTDTAFVLSPGLTADTGLTIGSTPGAAFSFGLMTWAEFPATTPLPRKTVAQLTSSGAALPDGHVGPLTVIQNPQFFLGPYVGVRFGH